MTSHMSVSYSLRDIAKQQAKKLAWEKYVNKCFAESV